MKEELFVLRMRLLWLFVDDCGGWEKREIDGTRPHLYRRRWPQSLSDAASSNSLDSTIVSLFLDESDHHYAVKENPLMKVEISRTRRSHWLLTPSKGPRMQTLHQTRSGCRDRPTSVP